MFWRILRTDTAHMLNANRDQSDNQGASEKPPRNWRGACVFSGARAKRVSEPSNPGPFFFARAVCRASADVHYRAGCIKLQCSATLIGGVFAAAMNVRCPEDASCNFRFAGQNENLVLSLTVKSRPRTSRASQRNSHACTF